MSKTEKIVCAVTLIGLGGLWFASEGNVWGGVMVAAGALMALTLKAPAKAENALVGQDGIPKGFESEHQKWVKENPGFHDELGEIIGEPDLSDPFLYDSSDDWGYSNSNPNNPFH